ncbi:MAG: valine--tRNA ligase [Candidatus Chaera renei]|uniref:Valine--tRNA ligase n=1 Tax=Candidatus Chaera renei TaxID=2506947 RepID=A0A4Q0AJ37_9BACT|nr:MAG: valine--tRNA ligase [Candidatus Chaera renei]
MKLPKQYEPNQYEPSVYALWETSGVFRPQGGGEPYGVLMPPPNANGDLHIGHALTFMLEDILVRFYRQRGRDAVYIPGSDHAGFETWVVFERLLEKQGKSRFDFSREELYRQVWQFVEKYRGSVALQLRAMGVGASWEHEVFTLDPKVIDAVYDTFHKLWQDGLVYRGKRIVNYCVKHQTSFADIEVTHQTQTDKLYQVAYPLLDRVGELVVATTRPETILGDTAIAVHPGDPRYQELIGTKAQVPLLQREIPIVADPAVDPSFGTGAVKVTPAHDLTDYDIGQRHNLPGISVIGFNGKMSGEAVPPDFKGLSVNQARQRMLALLQDAEMLRGVKDYEHAVGRCYKCGTVIEPLLKDQWFVKVAPLAERAIRSIEAGEITFTPASRKKVLLQYLANLKDWNISRQIPWGIPIPAFQSEADPDSWIFDRQVNEPEIIRGETTYHRDEDTFDTWFSSGQWPFITTDYLSGGELKRFYPLSVMETGYDILYQWVSRMIMLGLYATGQVPFKHVYLHGLVLDEQGQKMSKSKGNVLNPQELIESFGADALRLGIIGARSAGQNQAFSAAKVIAGRNFANKLWNMARYVEGRVGEPDKPRRPKPATPADHWVIRQLEAAGKRLDELMAAYRFAEAGELVYHTIWDDVADWYIEASKSDDNPAMLAWVLETSLKLAHPFAPFVSETIWQTLAWEKSLLAASRWPETGEFTYTKRQAADFDKIRELVSEARFVMSQVGAGPLTLLYKPGRAGALLAENSRLIARLARLKSVEASGKPTGLRLAVQGVEAWLKVSSQQVYDHQQRLEARLLAARLNAEKLQARLGNPSYLKNAPRQLVDQTKQQLKNEQDLLDRLRRELDISLKS